MDTGTLSLSDPWSHHAYEVALLGMTGVSAWSWNQGMRQTTTCPEGAHGEQVESSSSSASYYLGGGLLGDRR